MSKFDDLKINVSNMLDHESCKNKSVMSVDDVVLTQMHPPDECLLLLHAYGGCVFVAGWRFTMNVGSSKAYSVSWLLGLDDFVKMNTGSDFGDNLVFGYTSHGDTVHISVRAYDYGRIYYRDHEYVEDGQEYYLLANDIYDFFAKFEYFEDDFDDENDLGLVSLTWRD